MTKGEGDDMGMVEDMSIICQGKKPKKQHKTRKRAIAKRGLINGSPYQLTCAHKKKKWQTKPLMNNDDWSTKKSTSHKKNEQRKKARTTSLLLFEAHGR